MAIAAKNKKTQVYGSVYVNLKNAVECKLPVSEEEVGAILRINAKAVLQSAKCSDGEIHYDGKVIFSALFGGGNLKKCEMGVEFSYKQDNKDVLSSDEIFGDIECENVKATVVNGIPMASCTLVFSGEVLKRAESEYVCDADDLCLKKSQTENLCVLETLVKDFELEDEFEVDYVITEVLWHLSSVKLSEITCGIGSITATGEVELTYICSNGEYKPVYDKKTVPFSYEFDVKSAMPDLIAQGVVTVNDVNLKVLVDENKNKSVVSVIIKAGVNASVCENQTISYVEDAFSGDCYLSFEKTPVNTVKCLGEKTVEKTVNYKGFNEFEKSTGLICPVFAKIEETELVVEDKVGKLTGVVQVGLLVNSSGNYGVETALVPFDVQFDALGDSAVVCAQSVFGLRAEKVGEQICVDFTVSFRIRENSRCKCKFISAITEGEKRVKSQSAISVYIPKPNDTLWDVCKAIGISEEDVMKINPDLTFPTGDDERIVIYREIK